MVKSNFEVYYLLGCLALKLAHHLGNLGYKWDPLTSFQFYFVISSNLYKIVEISRLQLDMNCDC